MNKPLTNEALETIAQAASRILATDGKAMATQYVYGALEAQGLFDMAHPKRSKIKQWEIFALADRSLFLSQQIAP